jgi:hypothetical protein
VPANTSIPKKARYQLANDIRLWNFEHPYQALKYLTPALVLVFLHIPPLWDISSYLNKRFHFKLTIFQLRKV